VRDRGVEEGRVLPAAMWTCGVKREESDGPLVSDHGSVGFAGADMLFLCPSSNIHRVDSCARIRAHGYNVAPVSTPAGFVARGFAGILYPLPVDAGKKRRTGEKGAEPAWPCWAG
jgi:hypothetical protein